MLSLLNQSMNERMHGHFERNSVQAKILIDAALRYVSFNLTLLYSSLYSVTFQCCPKWGCM
jgi:hypothetical protein